MNKADLALSLGYLIGQLLNGDMDNPLTLATTLQGFADRAWEECDRALEAADVPPSIRIDP